MAYIPDSSDPFAGGNKSPALSWKGLPVGSVFTLHVLEPAKLLHSRNFETNEPDFWDPEKTQPKLSAVVNVRVVAGPHSVGEDRSVWAQKPSNLFAAIADAQSSAGARIAAGGTLHLKFAGETPHENKRYSAIKQYAARYEPPVGDAFTASPASSPAPAPGLQSWGARPATTMAPTTPQPATAGKPTW